IRRMHPMDVRRFGIAAMLVAASFGAGPAGARGAEPAGAGRPSRLYTIEQFMDTMQMGGASFSADETRILLSSNRPGIFNADAVPVAGGEPTPVTRSTVESTFAVSYFPKDDRILVTYDQGGNEYAHLYVIRDGKEQDLTPGKSVKARFLKWTRDG